MKQLLFALLSCALLSACGTEIGNGIKPKKPDTHDKEDATNAPNSGGVANPTTEASSPDNASLPIPYEDYFFIACASPFAKASAGRYVSDDGIFEVILDGEKRLITFTKNGTERNFTVTPAPTASQAYAIEPVSTAPSLECAALESTVPASGKVRSTVRLSNSMEISWLESGNTLLEFSLTSTESESPLVYAAE